MLSSYRAQIMIDLQPLLDSSADGDWITSEAAKLVSEPDFNLLNLVTNLGPVLTSTSTEVRVSGVGLLSSVLGHESVISGLSHQELGVLLMFYTDR